MNYFLNGQYVYEDTISYTWIYIFKQELWRHTCISFRLTNYWFVFSVVHKKILLVKDLVAKRPVMTIFTYSLTYNRIMKQQIKHTSLNNLTKYNFLIEKKMAVVGSKLHLFTCTILCLPKYLWSDLPPLVTYLLIRTKEWYVGVFSVTN